MIWSVFHRVIQNKVNLSIIHLLNARNKYAKNFNLEFKNFVDYL